MNKTDFRGPKPSRVMLSLAGALSGVLMRRLYGIVSMQFDDEDVARFSSFGSARVLIAPNHPTNAEPGVLFCFSRRLGQLFHFVSNREAFGFGGGLFGWFLQKVGVYSIVRGAPDRESFKKTRELLSQGPNRVVIFPEGEVYSQNDSILPFHAGVFQLAFFALEDMEKAGISEPLMIQPVAVKYRFTSDMAPQAHLSMSRLERALALRGVPPIETTERLRRIGFAVIASAEKMYGIKGAESGDLDARITAVKEAMIQRVAEALDIDLQSLRGTLPEKMRTLINEVFAVTREDVVPDSVYEVRLREQERDRAEPLMHDLKRLSNWIAVRDHYVSEDPTQERLIDTLKRLEIEVFGKHRIKGLRRCKLELAEPIDLREFLSAYRENKKGAVMDVTSRVEDAVQRLLVAMAV